jgi:hypothetical protein
VGWPAPRCTSCRCSCHSSAFALTFTHFCGLPHSTHGSTSQCLAAHCTFALSPRLLLASCPCTTPTEQVRECCSPTPALGEQPSRLMRLDPFHHFANLSPSNCLVRGFLLMEFKFSPIFFVVDQFCAEEIDLGSPLRSAVLRSSHDVFVRWPPFSRLLLF